MYSKKHCNSEISSITHYIMVNMEFWPWKCMCCYIWDSTSQKLSNRLHNGHYITKWTSFYSMIQYLFRNVDCPAYINISTACIIKELSHLHMTDAFGQQVWHSSPICHNHAAELWEFYSIQYHASVKKKQQLKTFQV